MDEENAKTEVIPKRTTKKAPTKSSAKTAKTNKATTKTTATKGKATKTSTKSTTKATTKTTKKPTNSVKSTKAPAKSSKTTKTTKTTTKSPAKKTISKAKEAKEKKPTIKEELNTEKSAIKEEITTKVEEVISDEKIEEPKVENEKTEVKTDSTFKMASKQPVQTNTKKKNNKKEKSNHTFLKFIFIVFAIIAFAYVAIVIHNATLMKEIMNKLSNTKDMNNYHCVVTSYEGSEKNTTIDVYKKDNISKVTFKDGEHEMVMWKNEQTNEGLVLYPNQMKVGMYNANEVLGFTVESFYTDDQSYLNVVCLSSFIYTSEFNGKKCYVINHLGDEIWIDKETGNVVKTKGGVVIKEDGTELTTSVEYTDWKVNSVTDEEVAKPDLVGYTIIK